jgi:hypothetical protein
VKRPAEPTLFDLGAEQHEAPPGDETRPTGRQTRLASFLAGWRWPGAGSFDRLPKRKQQAAIRAAIAVEEFLQEGDD